MTALNLSNDELLSTTRAVRKRLDLTRPVEIEIIKQCLELALQAPTASNSQNWQFLIVTDADKRQQIADFYRRAFAAYRAGPGAANQLHQNRPALQTVQERVISSADYLAEHLHQVPVFLIPCISGRVEAISGPLAAMSLSSRYGSILPAAWSFMLAARSRGLGTCWTTLHLKYEREVADLLNVPFEKVTQVALIPVAYTQGTTFRPASRRPLEEVIHLNGW